MSTRVFILEDELIHAEALKIALEEAGLELVGECSNADLAFDLIAVVKPDVLLVDIALPGFNNGITVADRVRRELRIPHIYTTSFSREEIIRQAVETRPAGYLRKPVDSVNLRAAVEIALHIISPEMATTGTAFSDTGSPERESTQKTVPEANSAGVVSYAETLTGKVLVATEKEIPIFTRVGDKLVRINPDELLMVRADGENYISLVFEKKELSCRITLKEFCSQLPLSFIQVHRAYYINLRFLESFNERDQTALLKGRQAPVGRSYRKAFLDSLRKI